jgi:hypothetical protein
MFLILAEHLAASVTGATVDIEKACLFMSKMYRLPKKLRMYYLLETK